MKVLITGGAGFIGSHIAEHFQNRAAVRILDNLRSGFRHNLDGLEGEFIEGSILDRARVSRAMQGVDYVFHLAALTSVPESMLKPAECVEINVLGTLVVLEEAARAGVKKLVLSSSAAVYGDNPALPKAETMLPSPRAPTPSPSWTGALLQDVRRRGPAADRLLRYFNVFGPRQDRRASTPPPSPSSLTAPSSTSRSPFTAMAADARFHQREGRGGGQRVFCDAVGRGGCVQRGLRPRITIGELAAAICRLTGSRSEIRHAPERAGDIKHSVAAIDKLRAAGFEPAAGFDEGCRPPSGISGEKPAGDGQP